MSILVTGCTVRGADYGFRGWGIGAGFEVQDRSDIPSDRPSEDEIWRLRNTD